MKINLITAETFSHEGGRITIKHTYSLDASEDFEVHTSGMTDDEILEAAEWMDFIDVRTENIEHSFYKAIRMLDNIEIGSSVEMSWINKPRAETVDEVKAGIKNLKFEISADVTFSLDYEAKTKMEKALVTATLMEVPKAKLTE